MQTILTKKEFETMCTLWNLDKPVSFHDILKNNEDLNRNTLLAVLNKLQEIQFIEVCGISYHKSSLTRMFQPIVTQADYYCSFLDEKGKERLCLAVINQISDPKVLQRIMEYGVERLENLQPEISSC